MAELKLDLSGDAEGPVEEDNEKDPNKQWTSQPYTKAQLLRKSDKVNLFILSSKFSCIQ